MGFRAVTSGVLLVPRYDRGNDLAFINSLLSHLRLLLTITLRVRRPDTRENCSGPGRVISLFVFACRKFQKLLPTLARSLCC
jgi:hypothetical protein